MKAVARTLVCAGLAVFAAGSLAHAAPPPASLTSFAPSLSDIAAYDRSASRFAAQGQAPLNQGFPADLLPLPAAHMGAGSGFGESLALSPVLALDSGTNLDIASRFTSFDNRPDPLINTASFLNLGSGGHYGGITYLPAPNLKVRLGASLRRDRLDSFTFAPLSDFGMAQVFDGSQNRSLLAGASWDLTDWVGLGANAISTTRTGTPLGYGAGLGSLADRVTTNALGVSGRMGMGNGWVTTADYNQGFSQLNQRNTPATTVATQSYAITVAKHGVFGDDTLGFSFSRPAANMVGSFASLTGSGDLPPMILAHGQGMDRPAQETDFQLGYVTSFLGGNVALQTNAAYQMAGQGQSGATALSVLSRAKIKF